uniref:Equilibrative nucleoside transporter n=1 Tax=Tetraselmis chuii TaxID=63592 RepID=A0A7S1SXV4_9CHLO|mmetsp:Transcript_35022/g.62442  ORF Transcript_35022/g.62442 Transcript_35022/m.62442 type:complete len:448 (+) Transcript_35022:146-1489(+)
MSSGRVPPKDKYNVTYWCYLFMGLGLLLPWNAFITAVDYFTALYPGQHVDRVIPVAYNVPNLLAMSATLPFSQSLGARLRIILGFSGFLAATIAIPVIDAIMLGGSREGTSSTYAITLFFAALLGASDGVAQGSLFGAAGCLPAKYTQAVCSGTSWSGLVVSMLRIVTKAALPTTPAGLRSSAFLYFEIASVIVALCIIIDGVVIPRLSVVRHFKACGPGAPSSDSAAWRKKGDAFVTSQSSDGAGAVSATDTAEIEMVALEDVTGNEEGGMALLNSGPQKPQLEFRDYLAVVQHMKLEAVSLVIIYWVTLAIFPGFLAEDVHSEEIGDWYPILLITAYNFGDVAGKCGPLVFPFFQPRLVLLLSAVRFVFVPAFYFASVYVAPAWVIGLLTLALGATNGHLTACAMMSAPRGLDQVKAELSGILSALFLVVGITIGAFSGYVWGVV